MKGVGLLFLLVFRRKITPGADAPQIGYPRQKIKSVCLLYFFRTSERLIKNRNFFIALRKRFIDHGVFHICRSHCFHNGRVAIIL